MMEKMYFIFILISLSFFDIYSQNDSAKIGRRLIIQNVVYREITKDSICYDNPTLVERWFFDTNDLLPSDTSEFILTTYCDKVTKIGFRYDFGFSQYIYTNSVADWLGYHQGTSLLDFTFIYNNLNFGFRFKPWTTNPVKEFSFDNKVLPKNAEVNPFKFDYFIGYDYHINERFSLEPSIGYTKCTFKVINEDKLNQHYNFNSTDGLLLGLTFNKYLRVSTFKYVLFFGRINYGFVDYSKIHKDFGNGYMELCAGISYKFYWTNRVYHVIR